MSMTIGVISGMVALGAFGIGYYLYNSKNKSIPNSNSKPEIKVKEIKQKQKVELSQKTYAPLNYVPKNTKPTPKTTYNSNSNQNRKNNNHVEDDYLLNTSIGFGIISSASDDHDSHKHSYHSSHSYHDSHDSGSSSHSSYDSGGSSDSSSCDCGGCD